MALHDGILYACPVGPLAEQLAAYFAEAARTCGVNEAHAYPAHITVTGFFHDTQPDWSAYRGAVEAAAAAVGPPPAPVAAVTGLVLQDEFHLLAVTSPWLCSLAAAFAALAPSATRVDAVRPKTGLHVSLAYGFEAAAGRPLATLATQFVDPQAAVEWELRLYERAPGNRWLLHASWQCATLGG